MSVTTVESSIEGRPVAEEAAPPRRPSDHAWVWQVTALSIALGVLLALAINTTSRMRTAGLPGNRFGISAALLGTYKEQNEQLQDELKDLRKQVTQYQNNVDSTSKSVELMKQQLEEIKARAGLLPVEGPGLKIRLQDSTVPPLPDTPQDYYMVHDADINGLLNELKAAGAEALAISGADPKNLQRIIVTTAARCVGPTAVVNGTQLAAPYTILAIGNPKELKAALEMPEGFIKTRGLDVLKMATLEEADHLVLPEYSGSLTAKYARPATASK